MQIRNLLFTFLGLLSFILAMIGVLVPGLPTTPFLLLSSVLFCKSHPALYHWLISHPRWGDMIRRFNDERVIPLPIKILAITMMSIMIVVSITIFITNLWVKIAVCVLGAIGTWLVLSYPSRPIP